MRRVGLVILAFIFLGLFSDISGAATTCTPPVSGAWIIPPGVTCTFNGQTIDVPGSTINPYWSGSQGINVYVYGTLDFTGGAINLNDPTSAGVIDTVKGGKLYLRGTTLTTKSAAGGVGIIHFEGGLPAVVSTANSYTMYTYLSGITFVYGDFYGGTVDILDSTITNYDYNWGNTKATLTRVTVPAGSVTNAAGTLSVFSSNLYRLGSAGGILTVKDSTVSNLIQIGGGTADFNNVAANNAFQLFGDSTTTISNSQNLNEIYVWSDSWLGAGHPTVSVSNSKAKTIVTNIGGTTQLAVDDLGTMDGTYKNYASKIIQSSSHPRYKITLSNADVSRYILYAFGSSKYTVTNSKVLMGEITGNADVTFDNSDVYSIDTILGAYYAYIYGNSKVTFKNSRWKRHSTYLYDNAQIAFAGATLSEGSIFQVQKGPGWSVDVNVKFSGTVTIGPNDATGLTIQNWAPGSKITREYPVYIGTAGAAVTIKDISGSVLWSGISNTDKLAYPIIVFDNTNYLNKFTLDVAGVGSKEIDFWTSTPIEFTAPAPSDDSVPPILTIDSPIAGDNLINNAESSSVTITGTATDSSLSSVKVKATNGITTQEVSAAISGTAPNFTFTATLNLAGFSDGTITFTATATDLVGNQASDSETATLDKTLPLISINTPTPYGLYTVGMALDFSASDSLSGVATTLGTLTNTAGESIEVTSGFKPASGVYTLAVRATDLAGNTAESDPVFFVVYDPEGGFATGGGWFYPDSESTLPGGKASFGFVAKYKQESSTGNLEFQYQDAKINLKSTSIDWLVISGVSAQFQGTGTINGVGLYTFRVLAKDNAEPGAGVDHFDIRIWEGTNTEADPYHKAKNTLAGGNIAVHKK